MDIWDKQPCGVGQGHRASSPSRVTTKPTSKDVGLALRTMHLCGALHVLVGISLTHEPKLSNFPYLLPFHVP
jgi:hypothetical protein